MWSTLEQRCDRAGGACAKRKGAGKWRGGSRGERGGAGVAWGQRDGDGARGVEARDKVEGERPGECKRAPPPGYFNLATAGRIVVLQP